MVGKGSFGEIYSGETVINHEDVAIKLEPVNAKPQQLYNESKVYRALQGNVGFAGFKWYGLEGDYNILIIDLLSLSLEELFNQCNRNFSLKTVLMLAEQMISRIEFMHSKGFIHRDIKPENFMIGHGISTSTVFLIDFGLSRRFFDVKNGNHIEYRDGKTLTGTARYSSVNTHLGIEQSRRDDLEGIAYVLLYFLKGSLPWQGIRLQNRNQKYEKIAEMKMTMPPDVLCEGLPLEFKDFLEDIRKLDFQDKPNYRKYKDMFRNLFIRQGYVYDGDYDWEIQKRIRAPVASLFTTVEDSQEMPIKKATTDRPGPTRILPVVGAIIARSGSNHRIQNNNNRIPINQKPIPAQLASFAKRPTVL